MRDMGLLDVGGFRRRQAIFEDRTRAREHGWQLGVAGVIAVLTGLGLAMLHHAGVLQLIGQ